MFSIYDQRFRDFLLLFIGFLGALWYFQDIGNHWMPSVLDMKYTEEEAVAKADSIFTHWNFQKVDLFPATGMISTGLDADSMQRKFGTQDFISKFKNASPKALPIYSQRVRRAAADGPTTSRVDFNFADNGELLEFFVSQDIINAQTPSNDKLIAGFVNTQYWPGISSSTLDTLVNGLIDYQHNRESSLNYLNMRSVMSRIATKGQEDGAFAYLNYESIWKAVDYYVNQSYWKDFTFTQDSLSLDEENGYKIARAYLTSTDTVWGVVPKLEIEVLPAGNLKKLKAVYFESSVEPGQSNSSILDTLFLISVFIFGVWLLIVFYLRIKANAIDTGPALVVALLTGFLVSSIIGLELFKGLEITSILGSGGLINRLFTVGFVGAISSVGFFLMTSVSDSITRQYWPVKLNTWDLVRRGMFNNKPVGWAILRGIALGGVLIGIYIILLDLIPGIYLESAFTFSTSSFLFGSLARQLINLLISLLVVVPVFLIITNQVLGMGKRKWMVPLISGLCFMLIGPLILNISPFEQSLVFNFTVGLTLGLFYLTFDFLTITLGLFICLNFLTTPSGWLINNSPDSSVFYFFIFLLTFLSAGALFFIYKGNERDELPDYVPDYLEHQAKQQRLRQELDIARLIQLTFLPIKTPSINGFDTAAICDPAMDTGGDYYDIIAIDEHRSAIAIGDVSGKGIRAAFYMTFAKGVIHSLCNILLSPKELLTQANRSFNKNATRGTFISMIYGVLNAQEKSFTYVRAGHNPMLIKRANGEIEWLQPKGIAIGMAKDDVFRNSCEEATLQLEKGDVLVLYTDGVTEAQNKAGAFYGEDRLYKLLKWEKTESSEELRNLIVQDVRAFYGLATQYDDMTLVVIKA